MLDTKHDPERYAEWLAHIESADTKEAFCFMVGLAACARSVVCHPQFKGSRGPIRDFRFLDQTSAQAFSIITNKNSLLFYFRKPAVTSGRYKFEALRLASPRASINTRGEWKAPLATIDDVRRLWNYLSLD